MITGGEIRTGAPISYDRMRRVITITQQDVINFVKELWQPHGKNGHWFWLPSIRNRYAKFETEQSGRVKPVHFMWQASHGVPPEDANIVLRKCLDEVCVNPDHLHNYTVKEVSELKQRRKRLVEGARLLEEFKRIKAADKHFYESEGLRAFTEGIENSIKKVAEVEE